MAIHHSDRVHLSAVLQLIRWHFLKPSNQEGTWVSLGCSGKGPLRSTSKSFWDTSASRSQMPENKRVSGAMHRPGPLARSRDPGRTGTLLGLQRWGFLTAVQDDTFTHRQSECDNKEAECPQESPPDPCAQPGAHAAFPPALPPSCLELVLTSLLTPSSRDPWISGGFPGPGLVTSLLGSSNSQPPTVSHFLQMPIITITGPPENPKALFVPSRCECTSSGLPVPGTRKAGPCLKGADFHLNIYLASSEW